jgi:hypothetical protein
VHIGPGPLKLLNRFLGFGVSLVDGYYGCVRTCVSPFRIAFVFRTLTVEKAASKRCQKDSFAEFGGGMKYPNCRWVRDE